MTEYDESEGECDTMVDNDQTVKLSTNVFNLDVTSGSIKHSETSLSTPSYYINNYGPIMCINGKLFAQGFSLETKVGS
jgi:hypothetical protein